MQQRIVTELGLEDVDWGVLGEGFPTEDKALAVCEFLSAELAKAGGLATVEVDGTTLRAVWDIPDLTNAETGDVQQVSYVSHLLQAGIMVDPSMQIAHTAYAGGLIPLSMILFAIHNSGKNRYMAERDSGMLAMAAPMSSQAWLMYGLILLDNGKQGEAVNAFKQVLALRKEFLALKYLAIAITVSRPDESVILLEECLGELGRRGAAPDSHLRAAYGMALLAVGSEVEAGVQFMLACGHRKPAMTPAQWVRGGYKCTEANVAEALAPKKKGKKPKA